MNEKKYIYISSDKKLDSEIDYDLTYSDEEEAIEAYVDDKMESSDNHLYEKYKNGEAIELHVFELDENSKPVITKTIEVQKMDGDGSSYKVTEVETYDLPDDFKPYSESVREEKVMKYEDALFELFEYGIITEETLQNASSYLTMNLPKSIIESALGIHNGFYEETTTDEMKQVISSLHAAKIMVESSIVSKTDHYIQESVNDAYDNGENALFSFLEGSSLNQLHSESDILGVLYAEAYVCEKTLKSSERNELSSDEFGIPSLRKYPMPDKSHVKAAIQKFNFVDKAHEKELADNIIKKIKKFGMEKEIQVGKMNRFKKYYDGIKKEFTESYDVYPFSSPYITEFNVGNMLPMMGNRNGWGTNLSNEPIENVIAADDEDINFASNAYDEFFMKRTENFSTTPGGYLDEYQAINGKSLLPISEATQLIPKHNLIFDKEVEKLVRKLKDNLDNPKNKFLEDILKNGLNFRKTQYTFAMNSFNGKEANRIINGIKSCGFKPINDEGIRTSFEKTVQNILIHITLDSVADKLKISYEELKTVKEASSNDIDSDILPAIKILNDMGYKTLYSCSGHINARFKSDVYKDGVKYNSLYTTARIVFDKDYDLKPPKGWKKKSFDGKMGFYPEVKNYNYSDGMPNEAFARWKEDYMGELNDWVNDLKGKPGPVEDDRGLKIEIHK